MSDLTAMMANDDFFFGVIVTPKERAFVPRKDVERQIVCEPAGGEDLSRYNYLNMEDVPDYKAIDAANPDSKTKKAKTISCMRCRRKFTHVHELVQHTRTSQHWLEPYKETPPLMMKLRQRDAPPPPLEPGPIRSINPTWTLKPSYKPYVKPASSHYGK